MDRKAGEIFEHKGEWYQAVEGIGCRGCDFKCVIPSPLIKGCATLNFKKLEKVGEPYLYDDVFHAFRTILVQRYRYYVYPLYPTTEDVQFVEFNRKTIGIKLSGENIKEKILYLKPFDLQAAKAGRPVCTRDGRKAKIVYFDANSSQPIIALVVNKEGKEQAIMYDEEGVCGVDDNLNLMMLVEKKEGWVNIFPNNYLYDHIYPTKEEALKYADRTLDTVKITWEE